MIDYVQNLSGDELKKYIVKTVDTLKVAEQQTTPGALSAQVYSVGIVAIGATWGAATLAAHLSGAVGLAAIIQGLTIATVATAVSVIIIALLVVFIPFLVFMEKKAEILGFVLNRTTSALTVNNIYMAHGKMVSLSNEEDFAHLPNKVFCPAGTFISTKMPDGSTYTFELAYAGFVYASKRDYALIGVEGALQFKFSDAIKQFPNGINIGFSVPLSAGKNKCGISANSYHDAKDFFDKEYDKFKTSMSVKAVDNAKIEIRVNSHSGGEVYMIATICQR